MQYVSPLDLVSASIRVTPSSGRENAAEASPFLAPVDAVSISRPVAATPESDSVPLDAFAYPRGQQHQAPSLSTMLDEIRRHIEAALEQMREERPDFFERLDELRERLEGVIGADQLAAAGEWVAATAAERMDDFLKAAETLAGEIEGQAAHADSDTPPRLALDELGLNLELASGQGMHVRLERLGLRADPPSNRTPEGSAPRSLRIDSERVWIEPAAS